MNYGELKYTLMSDYHIVDSAITGGAFYTPDGNTKILSIHEGDIEMVLVKSKKTNECGYYNPVTGIFTPVSGATYEG